jgi:hypothetical protein
MTTAQGEVSDTKLAMAVVVLPVARIERKAGKVGGVGQIR